MPLPSPTPYFVQPMYLTIEEARSYESQVFTNSQLFGIDFSVVGNYSDQKIVNLIRQASNRIDGCIGDTLTLRVNIEETRGQGQSILKMAHWPIWNGANVFLTAPAAIGDTSITVDDTLGLQPGKILNFTIREDFFHQEIVSGKQVMPYYGGPGVIQLQYPLLSNHPSGEKITVYGVDFITSTVPTQQVNINAAALLVQYSIGLIESYNPLSYQLTGYHTRFPKNVPLNIQYTSGYEPRQYPGPLRQACFELMLDNVLSRRSEGLKRVHSGVRSEEYEDASTKMGMPEDIKCMLSQFRRNTGFF